MNSCKREDNKPQQTSFPVPQEVKDYMYFKPGTYWVYKDSVNGVLDTATVSNAYITSATEGEKYYEEANTICNSSFDGFTYNVYVNTSFSDKCLNENRASPCYNVLMSKYGNSQGYIGESILLFYNLVEGFESRASLLGTGNSRVKLLSNNYICNIAGLSVDSVSVFVTTSSRIFNNSTTVFYLSKGIGVVRKEIYETNGNKQIWNLIDYRVIK